MRIVPNLNETTICPNCGRRGLIRTTNEFGRPFKQCQICTEEIFENEFTISEEEAQEHVFNVGKAPDAIDDSLMNIEYAVSDLTRYATTQHELDQMERIRDIFDELISVIRRMK